MGIGIFDGPTPPAPDTVGTKGVAIDAELYGVETPAPTELHPPEVQLRSAFRARLEDVSVGLGLSEPQRQARHREFVGALRSAGLDAHTVGEPLYRAFTDAQLAAARNAPPDDATRRVDQQRRQEDLRLTFRNEYKREGEELLERTRAFVRAHPKLQAIVGAGGIDADPTVMKAIAEHVRKSYWRPS